MSDFSLVGVTDLQELREDVRVSRKVLSVREQLALIDLALRAKEAVRVARAEAAAAQERDLFGPDPLTPSPVRLPGGAEG